VVIGKGLDMMDEDVGVMDRDVGMIKVNFDVIFAFIFDFDMMGVDINKVLRKESEIGVDAMDSE
ncbi:hypothetical protein KI387_030120, partial [Taxus chinensis]